MSDTTSLVIKVDSTDVKTSTTALNDLGKAGDTAEHGVKKTEKASAALAKTLRAAAAAATAYITAIAVDKTIKVADAYTLVEGRLKLVTKSAKELEKVQISLFEISQKTRADYAATSNVYSRFAQAMKDAKVSQSELLSMTKTLNQAFTVSGANNTEAENAMIQLSQAMSSGVLRGEEFNSISEQGGRIMQMLADYTGKSRGELRAMAEQGLLTANVLRNAIAAGAEEVNKEFSNLPVTVGQATTVLANSFGAVLNWANKSTGATGKVAKAFIWLSETIEKIPQFLGWAVGEMRIILDGFVRNIEISAMTIKSVFFLAFDEIIEKVADVMEVTGRAMSGLNNIPGIEINVGFNEQALALRGLSTATEDYRESIDKINESHDKNVAGYKKEQDAAAKVSEGIKILKKSVDEYAGGDPAADKAAKKASEKAIKEAARLAKQAAEEYAAFYQSTLDRLLPLVKEQEDYNKALAVLKDMDPSQSTEAYITALDNLEKSLTVNIEKAAELRSEVERLAENIQLGSTGPDELRNESATTEIQQQNELILLQEVYNEKVEKQVAIQKELGAAYGLSAEEAEKLKRAFASEQIMKEVEALEYLSTFSGQDFGNEIADGINRAALSISKMNTMFEEQLKIQDKIKIKREEITNSTILDANQRKKGLKELDDLESTMLTDQLSGYSNLFGTIGQMFDENSQARKNMHALEMAFAAAEIAINVQKAITSAVAAIANQGSGDPYTAFARIAAMVALMGGIVGMVGGSLSGGGSSSVKEAGGKTATTGTVFGDSSAESQSLKNATELLSEFEEKQYSELRGIHREMVSLNSNITGLVTGLIRSVGGEFSGGLISEAAGKYLGGVSASTINMIIDPLAFAISKPLSKIIPIVGDLYDGLSSLIGGILGGSTKTSITGSGIAVGSTTIGSILSGGSANALQYQDVQTKKKGALFGLVGGSTKNRTVYQEANDEVTKLFTQIFVDMGQTIIGLTEGLGGDLSTALSYAFSIPNLNLMGKTGEEITKAVEAAISTAFDNAADAILGDIVGKYQKVSEGMFETAVRVYTEQIIVLDALGRTGNKTAGDLLELTQSIVDLAGGGDEFMAYFENYIELFTTDNQKLQATLKFTQESFSDLGMAFPTTRKGFSDLVSSLDVTTESGRMAYITLLTLADSADQLYSAIEDVMESVNDTLNKLGLSDAEKSLYELIEQYDEYIEVLKASGAALSDVGKAEQARIGVLKEAAGDLLSGIRDQVEDFATALKSSENNIQSAYENAVSKQESAQERVNSLLEKSSVNLESFSKSIDSFLKSLDLKTLESSFENLKTQFMVTASAAAAGDSEAIENLLSQANSVLSGAAANSSSRLDYDRIVAMVKSQVKMVQNSIDPSINNDLADAKTELATATNELAQFQVLAIKAGVTLEESADKTAKLLADLDEAYNEAFLNNIVGQQQYQIALSLTNDLTFETATALSELIGNVNALRVTMSAYNSSLSTSSKYTSSGFDPANIMYMTSQLGASFDVLAEIEKYKETINNQISGSFATGTDYVPYDMTANIHQGERIVPAAYNRSDKTNAELLAEISALRKEMNAVMYQVAKNTLKTADYAERQDGSVLSVVVVEDTSSIFQRETQVVGNTITPDFAVTLEDGTLATKEDGTAWLQEGE